MLQVLIKTTKMKKLLFSLIFFSPLCQLFAQNLTGNPFALGHDPTVIEYNDINETVYDCSGNSIDLSGTEMVLMHWPPAGDKGTLIAHFNYIGVSGINQATGERYHLLDHESFVIKIYASGRSYLVTMMRMMHLVGQKTGTSIRFTSLRHITINRDGTWEIITDQRNIKCDNDPTRIIRF
jgi:hypothetical protein